MHVRDAIDMLPRLHETFHFVKNELYCTNGFMKPGECKLTSLPRETARERDNTVFFMREIPPLIRKAILSDPQDVLKFRSFNPTVLACCVYILKAILASAYKLGRCDEYIALSLMDILKKGFTNLVEVIAVSGTYRMTSVVDSHLLMVFDRDPQKNISEPGTLKKIIKFDPWGDKKVMLYHGSNSPTLNDLGAGAMSDITKIEVDFCLDRNLTQTDLDHIIIYLTLVKKLLTPSLLKCAYANSERTSINIEKELLAIHSKIDAEILCFTELKQAPPLPPSPRKRWMIRHYDSHGAETSYNPQLWKPNPKQYTPPAEEKLNSGQALSYIDCFSTR